MVQSATENCSKCGKEINLKNVASYKVLPNFRLICADCAIAEGLIIPPKPTKAPAGAGKKQPQRN